MWDVAPGGESVELTHVAVVTNSLEGATVWLQPVTDREYNRFW